MKGRFRRKSAIVEAEIANRGRDLKTAEGIVHADVGDVIVTHPAGQRWPWPPHVFCETFEPVDAAGENIVAAIRLGGRRH